MCPEGFKSHHVSADFLSKSALPRCQILGVHLVVQLFLHILYLCDMHSWRWLAGPLSLLCEFVGTYHHSLLQWQWYHPLMVCFLMAVTPCCCHLESWPWYDKILAFWWGGLTALLLLHAIPCSGQLAVIPHLSLTICLHWHRCFWGEYHHLYCFCRVGYTVCYFIVHTIDMHDGAVDTGEELPPSYLSVQQVLLGLKVFEALVVSH